MKSGEGGFRRSRPTQTVHPVIPRAPEPGRPDGASKTGLSKRAQRRFEESEERRRQRHERKRNRKTEAASEPSR